MAASWYTCEDLPDERDGLSFSGITSDTLAMVQGDMVAELVGLVSANAGDDVYLRALDVLARGGRDSNPELSKRLRAYCDAAAFPTLSQLRS